MYKREKYRNHINSSGELEPLEIEYPEIGSWWKYKDYAVCQVINVFNHEIQRFQRYTQPVIVIYRADDLCFYSVDMERFKAVMTVIKEG